MIEPGRGDETDRSIRAESEKKEVCLALSLLLLSLSLPIFPPLSPPPFRFRSLFAPFFFSLSSSLFLSISPPTPFSLSLCLSLYLLSSINFNNSPVPYPQFLLYPHMNSSNWLRATSLCHTTHPRPRARAKCSSKVLSYRSCWCC